MSHIAFLETGITDEVAQILALSFSPRSSITKLNLTRMYHRNQPGYTWVGSNFQEMQTTSFGIQVALP
jgi:hypothetical protein